MRKIFTIFLFLFFTGIIFAPGKLIPEAETIPVPIHPFRPPIVRPTTMWVEATAYGPPLFPKGKKTFSKTPVGPNVVAVDPKVIPLKSIIEIGGVKYRAEDTGRLIKGKKIDIWQPNPKQFGRRMLRVKIIKPVNR